MHFNPATTLAILHQILSIWKNGMDIHKSIKQENVIPPKGAHTAVPLVSTPLWKVVSYYILAFGFFIASVILSFFAAYFMATIAIGIGILLFTGGNTFLDWAITPFNALPAIEGDSDLILASKPLLIEAYPIS